MSRTNTFARYTGVAVFWAALVAAFFVGLTLYRTHIINAAPEFLSLDWRGQEVKLIEPRALGLLLLLPIIPAIQFFTVGDFGRLQNLVNSVLRMAVIVALTAALVRPSISRYDSELCVVYAVDVSESVPDSVLPQAQAAVQAGWDSRGGNLVRLVTFADRPQIVPIDAGSREVPAIERHTGPGAGLASNPAAAMRLSYGLCPQDHLKRVVMITDGNENRGDLLAEAATANDFGVRVFAHQVAWVPEAEVLVRRVEFPPDIEQSEPFDVRLEIYSNRETTARVNITQNGMRDVRGRTVELQPGVNSESVTLEVYEPGERRFEIEVEPEGADRFEANNQWTRTLHVEGRPRVLYVEGESRSRHYLQRALDRDRNDLANFDLEVRSAHGFPTRLEEMAGYDLIIMSDIEARYMSRTAMRNIERYVRELGGGFLMVGGEHSFGPGGYDGTTFEDISPVNFDLQRMRELPSVAIMLVIDRSGSMDGLKIEMAKDAAQAVVEMMGPQDFVGVVAFDTEAQTVVRLQPASNRSRIRSDIGRIAPGGGTDIFPALEEAYLQLSAQRARLKHVIVLTDGQAPWDGIADLASIMRAEGMTISSVAVGREADRSLLEMIAELGGGRFYQTNDPGNVPQIFVQETSQVARTNLVEEPFRARPVRRSQATSGIDWAASPWLLGYVSTRAKRGARVLLETERGEPLFAIWRQGLGRVAVFTSDIKNRWAVEWVRNSIYPQFWAQVVRDMMRVETEEALAMTATIEEGRARVVVDAIDENDRFINGLTSTMQVAGPGGEQREIVLEQRAAGRYEADFEITEFGTWELQVEHELDGETVAVSRETLTSPYPDEYLAIEANPALVARVAALTGGGVNPEPAALWDPGDEEREYRTELWPWALALALALFVLDLLFRRVRFFGRRAISWGEVRAA